MKITLVSDLHLEFSDIEIKNTNNSDVLILGGDIMIAQDLHDYPEDLSAVQENIMNSAGLGKKRLAAQRYRDFLKRVSGEFTHVIYIAGNHEFYHGKWPDSLDYIREECSGYPNVYFLEMETKEIDDVVFVGATLWTDMNKQDPQTLYACQNHMNDYRVIRNSKRSYSKLSPIDTVRRHLDTVRYLKSAVNDPNKKYVVVGHHSPSKLSLKPRYEKDYLLNGAYSSDLSEFILDHPEIKLWTHGHTHDAFDYTIGSTRIVCNPRGYEGYEPDSGWDPNIIIEV